MPAETLAFVAVGSNLGDRRAHLAFARDRLCACGGVSSLRCSTVYETIAVGPGVQPDYLNAVFELCTRLDAWQLLAALQEIEDAAGRTREQRWAARTLDLDLLLFGELRQSDPRLTLPHPRLAERNFVVYPLHDLAPALRLPDGTALATLRGRLASAGLRRADLDLRAGACHA